ncbi:MAG: MerR family transcriptional regulator [Proteobacteria bacterium]|nr:MerR family transcriptional regulator [Desulfobacula sp.]MBU3954051.1 MerR family transcriptional regulator [Pseudomonadota bacterium]MBU4133174.1 MerR family transcriptional regulator [Pseudomonadota bacterium]
MAEPTPKNTQPLLKMKQLADATGVAKSTILLYVKKGLLPEPVKTSPNMAYYHPVCIDRIAFIKKVQTTHRLPLAAIKGLIREMDQGRDIAPLLELQTLLFGAAGEKMDKKHFCSAAGLTLSQVTALCRQKLLAPLEKECFDDQDLAVAKLLKECLDLGVDSRDLDFYPRAAKQIVDNEIRLREKYTQHLDFRANAGLTVELTRLARGLRPYIIDRTLTKSLLEFKGLNKI